MVPFQYESPAGVAEATGLIDHSSSMAIAGGTTMIDLMKLNVLTPQRVVHVRDVLDDSVTQRNGELIVGAACTMAALADHPLVHGKLPAVRQSLILAASPQIRNMATIGGNLLQRTRSTYFRHTDMPLPATSNAGGVDTSLMAVLGNHGNLVGMYPGDFAVTVVAFGGQIDLTGPQGTRTVAAKDFYQTPTDRFQYTTSLRPNELITSLRLPITPAIENSFYLKIRDRSSYAFALASTSVGWRMDGDVIAQANVGLGGLGSIPWNSPEAVDALTGKPASDEVFASAAEAALATANPPAGLEYKVPLAKRTIVRAMQVLRDQGPVTDEQLWTMQHGRG